MKCKEKFLFQFQYTLVTSQRS